MLKAPYSPNSILNTLSTSLPDDRPITAIQVVEYVEKCPRGYLVISKTHDQDQDADLWREASFLKRSKSGRYLCLSKSEGQSDLVVQEIGIFNEKALPPEGFSLLHRTADTEQKAWRKKQLCYRLVNSKQTTQAVTDIIVCNRLKKAPDGFTLAGEINGMTICYKMGNVQDTQSTPTSEFHTPLAPEVPPRSRGNTPSSQNHVPGTYPQINSQGDQDYEIILPGYTPNRPAPGPPIASGTLAAQYSGLEGVPFVLNPRLAGAVSQGGPTQVPLPQVKARTLQQLDWDYNYDFRVERHS